MRGCGCSRFPPSRTSKPLPNRTTEWWRALVAAGAAPANFAPPPGSPPAESATADVVEDPELTAHRVTTAAAVPETVAFLSGITRWTVVSYDGVLPIARAHVAAAVRRRRTGGALHTTFERARDFAVAPLEQMTPALRAALIDHHADIERVDPMPVGQPAQSLQLVETAVRRARAHLEREVAEAAVQALGVREWLVLDGFLSRSATVARHPRALGVVKSHGTQFLEGRGLEQALTLPAGHRTSVFRVQGGHTRTEVYSWYLRLWPWEGNDLLYGLLRIEAQADAAVVQRADAISAWLLTERAPLATPDPRWDRLLYPLHHVEEYLKARLPRDVQLRRASPLPRTGT